MRVLHFFKTYHPDTVGGIENMIYQLCRGTAQHGITSSVLTLTPGRDCSPLNYEGHIVYRARRDFHVASTGFSISALRQFSHLIREFDLVHYHFPWPFMDLAHFYARVKKPTVVSYHSDVVKQSALFRLYAPLMRRFLRSVDCIVANCPPYAETSPVLRSYRSKVDVVSIGLDKTAYPEPSAPTMARLRAQVGEGFFLFVGALRYYKGLSTLLVAAQGTGYPVVIAGIGPMESELRAQVARLGLANIHFVGGVSDEEKVALLKLSRAFVFPSHLRSEAFGISLLEAAMFGRPMISCEIGTGTTFINLADETGLVVAPNDPAAFRTAMKYLWEHPDIAARMGGRAEHRYQQLFTADKMVDGYCAIYRRLVEARQVGL